MTYINQWDLVKNTCYACLAGRSLPGFSAVMQSLQWLTAVDAGPAQRRGTSPINGGYPSYKPHDKLGFNHMTRFSTKNVHGLAPWTSEYQVGSGNRTNNWWTKATETWPPRDMRSIIRYVWALCFEVVHDWRRFILGSEHSAAINSTWIRKLWCLLRYPHWRHFAMFHTFHVGITVFSDIHRPKHTVGYLQFRYNFSHGYIYI